MSSPQMPQNPQESSNNNPPKKTVIVLDAGHFTSKDSYALSGTKKVLNGKTICEGDLTSQFTEILKNTFIERGYEVYLTSEHIKGLKGNTFDHRFSLVEKLKAQDKAPSAYLSLHFDDTNWINSAGQNLYGSGRGDYPQIYYNHQSSPKSKQLAQTLADCTNGRFIEKTERSAPIAPTPYQDKENPSLNRRGLGRDMPAVILELESMRHNLYGAIDTQNMKNLASQIVDGIEVLYPTPEIYRQQYIRNKLNKEALHEAIQLIQPIKLDQLKVEIDLPDYKIKPLTKISKSPNLP